MSWMSYDITFCDNTKCKKWNKCFRSMETVRDYPYPVSVSHFTPDERGRCSYFINTKEQKDIDEK